MQWKSGEKKPLEDEQKDVVVVKAAGYFGDCVD